jgi:protein-S-isoprenylcysteine O-methyltransferase Ste14
MGLSWAEQAFWVLFVLAILGAYWWARRMREHDARQADHNGGRP